MWPGLKRANALNGIIVSCAVLTDVPADALEWPLAASELIARLRAESAATVAALLVVDAVVPLVLVLSDLHWVSDETLELCERLLARLRKGP